MQIQYNFITLQRNPFQNGIFVSDLYRKQTPLSIAIVMKTTSIPTYRRAKEGKVLLVMTLDHRNGTEKSMPVCVRVGIGTLRRYFLMPDERYTLEEFTSIINEGNRKQGPKRKEFDDFFEKAKKEVKGLIGDTSLSPTEFMEQLRTNMNGLKEEEALKGKTIYDVWQTVLNELAEEGRLGTYKSYLNSLNRFKTDMGEKIPISSINQQLVDRWVAKMQKPKEGKPMSTTTIGIYLRAFRVVVRRAVGIGVMPPDKLDMFKGVKEMNRKSSRKEWYLNVEKMTRLYEFFEKGEAKDQEGNEAFAPDYKKRAFRSLGLFLFSYLANGANMADIAKLRYDGFYYSHGQQAMRFVRQKTMRETDGVEVIFPILPQMQVILDRIAQKPQHGGLVFDIITDGMSENRIQAIVSCENSNINDRMEAITRLLGMEERPTPTWCRHSYATNLRDAGVSTEYISTMMGHTITSGSATTLNYLSRYNMATMVENNSKLLCRGKQDNCKEALLNRLMEMDKERQEIMNKLMNLK